MAGLKFLTKDEFAKEVAEKALDEFLYDGKSIREWMQIIASEDAISRQAVLDLCERFGGSVPYSVLSDYNLLPPVSPQPKTGHWINAKVGKLFPSNDFKCSECGNVLNFDSVNCGRGDANYCPNCGAKMEA